MLLSFFQAQELKCLPLFFPGRRQWRPILAFSNHFSSCGEASLVVGHRSWSSIFKRFSQHLILSDNRVTSSSGCRFVEPIFSDVLGYGWVQELCQRPLRLYGLSNRSRGNFLVDIS